MNEQEQAMLTDLNNDVVHAIHIRKIFLDTLSKKYARVKIGENIYNLQTGERLGKVSKYYRYWQDRDEGVRDTMLSISYEYEIAPNVFDNTSRQIGLIFGRKDEVWTRE